MSLEEVELYNVVIVSKLNNTGGIRRRLLDLGIMENTRIQPVLASPSKHMRAYRVKGSIIALRSDESRMIEVEEGR